MTNQYIGIIDMEGLDTFSIIEPGEEVLQAFANPDKKIKSKFAELSKALRLRVWANAGRHPILFVCELDEEDVELMEYGDGLWKAQVILRNSKKIGFEKGCKANWAILKKLVPEYQGEFGNERYIPRTIETM